jgi:hypothetical protein
VRPPTLMTHQNSPGLPHVARPAAVRAEIDVVRVHVNSMPTVRPGEAVRSAAPRGCWREAERKLTSARPFSCRPGRLSSYAELAAYLKEAGSARSRMEVNDVAKIVSEDRDRG